jgi:hypothetical protein
MPFGKHAGRELFSLPGDYLSWLLENLSLYEPLKSAVVEELRKRGQSQQRGRQRSEVQQPRYLCGVPEELRPAIAEIVELGFRAAARVRHPDVGGTKEKMQELNAAREWLRHICAKANAIDQ